MIYEFPENDKPIEQGDIFYPVPYPTVDTERLPVIKEDGGAVESKWVDLNHTVDHTVLVPVTATWAIVASQNCDASRVPILSLFVINDFIEVVGQKPSHDKKANITKWWVNMITQESKANSKWFYLPEDDTLGFTKNMAVNFHMVIQIRRSLLEKNIVKLRKGELNDEATEHFRESIAQFFRRYPHDEWYPLNKKQFEYYNKEKKPPVDPKKWQT